MTFGEFLRYLLLIIFFPRSLKTMEWRMLRLLNKDRKKHKLRPLRMQEDLRQVARKHSKDMAQKDYFDHVNLKSQSPADRLKLARVTDVTSGENLAKIGGYPSPTQFAEEGLMNSPGHRANILNVNYNTVGIGIVQDLRRVYYFTQNFAKRDLILKRAAPKTVFLRKGLRLTGDAFANVKAIFYQIRSPNTEDVLLQKAIFLNSPHFDFRINFPSAGSFQVLIFSDIEGNGHFNLSNLFDIRVKKGFLG